MLIKQVEQEVDSMLEEMNPMKDQGPVPSLKVLECGVLGSDRTSSSK